MPILSVKCMGHKHGFMCCQATNYWNGPSATFFACRLKVEEAPKRTSSHLTLQPAANPSSAMHSCETQGCNCRQGSQCWAVLPSRPNLCSKKFWIRPVSPFSGPQRWTKRELSGSLTFFPALDQWTGTKFTKPCTSLLTNATGERHFYVASLFLRQQNSLWVALLLIGQPDWKRI